MLTFLARRSGAPASTVLHYSRDPNDGGRMRRTPLLLLLAVATLVIAACSETSSVTGPGVRNADGPCLTGYTTSDGRCVPDSL